MRRTVIVESSVAANAVRLQAARDGTIGLQVMTPLQVACRLAGRFLAAIDADTLAGAATDALSATPPSALGDLASISGLPGLPGTLAATLTKAWHADLDLQRLATERPGVQRMAVLARLEEAVLACLPAAMLRPGVLIDAALARIQHAPSVLGSVECRYLLHLASCWQRQHWFTVVDPDAELIARSQCFAKAIASIPRVEARLDGIK